MGMIEGIPNTFESQSVWKENKKIKSFVKKVDQSAAFLNENVFNSKSDEDRSNVDNKVAELMAKLDVPEGGIFKLKDTLDRGITNRQKEGAKRKLDILSTSVFIAMRYGDNEELRDVLGTGLVEDIEGVLPEDLKGLGKSVRSNIINDQQLLDELNRLDKVREKASKAGKFGEEILGKEIKKSMEKIFSMDTPDENQDQVTMVLSYLSCEIENSDGKSPDEKKKKKQKGVTPVFFETNRDDYSGETYGAPEGMNRIGPVVMANENIKQLEDIKTPEQIHDWMVKTLVDLSENPLFFACWWQSNTAEQLLNMINSKLNYSKLDYRDSDSENSLNKYDVLKNDVYATLSVLGMQCVDRNADANADSYGQFAPPKNMAAELHWDDGGGKYETLKKDPDIKKMLDIVFEDAFDFENGWKIVKAFSDGKSYVTQNNFLNELIKNNEEFRGKNNDVLMAKGRVAMAMFEVDWIPEWIRWANENKRVWTFPEDSNNRGPEVKWLKGGFNQDSVVPWEKYAYSGKLKTECPNGEECELGYDHPRTLRPWEVMSGAKGSYRERPEIVYRMDALLTPFIAKTMSISEGRWPRASQEGILDKYLKYGKVMSKITGGPQGLELDNLTTLDEIMPLAANFWGADNVSNNPEFGKFLSSLFALKAEAMFFPGYKSNAKITLNSIKALDLFSGEAEKKKALEGAIGPNGNLAHGWVAEVKRLYDIDLLATNRRGVPVYQEFSDAFLKVYMDTPNLKEARKTYKKAIKFLKNEKRINVFSTVAQIVKNFSKIKI